MEIENSDVFKETQEMLAEPQTILEAILLILEDKKELADALITTYELDPDIFYTTRERTALNMTKMSTWAENLTKPSSIPEPTGPNQFLLSETITEDGETTYTYNWRNHTVSEDITVITADYTLTTEDLPEQNCNKTFFVINESSNPLTIDFNNISNFIDMDDVITSGQLTIYKNWYAEISIVNANVIGNTKYIISSKIKQ